MRILRGNLLASVKSECTIAELYPGAIGHAADLDQKVVIRRVSLCRAAGSSTGTRSEIINYNPQAVPVQGADQPCDILTGDYLITNEPRAPVGDAISFHPKNAKTEALWEVLQPKSSDCTRNGMPIDPTSRAVLLTRDITAEVDKIPPTSHSKFFQGHKLLLVMISNKPIARTTSNSMYLCCFYTNIKHLQISLSQTSKKSRVI